MGQPFDFGDHNIFHCFKNSRYSPVHVGIAPFRRFSSRHTTKSKPQSNIASTLIQRNYIESTLM